MNIDDSLLQSILAIDFIVESKWNLSLAKEKIINNTKDMLEYFFALHNVLYLDNKTIASYDRFVDFPLIGDFLIKRVIRKAQSISPFNLPLTIYNDEIFSGASLALFLEDNNRKLEIYYRIIIDYVWEEIASSLYAHEVTHTQISRNSVQFSEHNEVISIFVEKLIAYQTSAEAFRAVQRYRAMNTIALCHLLNEGKKSNPPYIISDLKAESLFDLYINGSKDIQGQILNEIQGVFDGKKTVEAMLLNCGITSKLSDDALKRNLHI